MTEHLHPTINWFNPTGARFLFSTTREGRLALYRWDPPAGYTPAVMFYNDPPLEFRKLIARTFAEEYPLPCGCILYSDMDNLFPIGVD